MAKITGSSDQNRQLFLRVAVLEAGIGGIHLLGVANGKCETLRDRETTDFLCEPETF